MTTSPECALFRTMLFLVLIFANMLLTTRHGKLLGKYSGPGWNYLDIVFATGKNIKARLCLKKHVDDCHQNDLLEWNRYIIVQKNDPSPLELLEVHCSCSKSCWFYAWRTALVKIVDQKFFSKRYGWSHPNVKVSRPRDLTMTVG